VDLSNVAGATRPGYTFEGWYTAATGGSLIGNSVTMPAGGATYYAHWTADEQTINFDANGGTTTQGSISQATDSTVDLSNVAGATRPGYTFEGWYTAATGGSLIGNSVTMPAGGATYYAHWTADEQTINFDANGGTTTQGSISQATDSTVDLSNVAGATRPGYTFEGWYTAA
ncbi:InlB B-repeat-containing protein, partial [Lactiplantibacillus plantarum]|uniref:InlB B-repeat-containing protein n=1 Tax=Lactiplantibacillus plantarum TaxID=1590 RepID=UPI001BC03D2C